MGLTVLQQTYNQKNNNKWYILMYQNKKQYEARLVYLTQLVCPVCPSLLFIFALLYATLYHDIMDYQLTKTYTLLKCVFNTEILYILA